MLYLICLPSTAILAGKGRGGESVFAEICPQREKGWISLSEREIRNISLSSPLLQIAPSSLCLAHSCIQPATLLDEAVCHISSLPPPFPPSFPPSLSLSVSIHLLLTLHPPQHVSLLLTPALSPSFFLSLFSTLNSFEFPSILDLGARIGGWEKSREGWGNTVVTAVPWLFCCR